MNLEKYNFINMNKMKYKKKFQRKKIIYPSLEQKSELN